MDYSNDEIDEFMNYLEDEGVLEWVGMALDGERTFVFNFEKMHDIFPELYDAFIDELNNELLHLYELGMVTMEYNTDLTPKFKITEQGRKYLEESGIPVPEDLEE
jgi:hypothetical protein